MAREFISEINLLKLKQTCHVAAAKMDKVLFPDGSNSVNNLDCDEINDVIIDYIDSIIGKGSILDNLCYIVNEFSGETITLSNGYIYEVALVSEIVKHIKTFKEIIIRKCKHR